MRRILICILIFNALFLITMFNSFHQEKHRIIDENNDKLYIIQYLLMNGETRHVLKLLDEWGVEYCPCVAFAEAMIKEIGNKKYMWINSAWHRIPKANFYNFIRKHWQTAYENKTIYNEDWK